MKTKLFTNVFLVGLFLGLPLRATAAELTLDLGKSTGVTFVGAIARWDEDGNYTKPVNPKATIGNPEVTAQAQRQNNNRWVFRNLPAGRYDLVILARDSRVRVDGFHYPPVAEFDSFIPSTATAPEEAREKITKSISLDKHYENKVVPLFMGGDEKLVRVLVQLVRDKETSYDADYGAPVATVRHEVWQYDYKRGVWSKMKRTKILSRILLARSEFRQWTWVWEPTLGGIEVKTAPIKISYELPQKYDPNTARGWIPN
jgi:hypothetical protein